MNDDDLLARCWHWIRELPGEGHMYGCRGWPHLPPERREPCNCGRDPLLADISAATAQARTTNGAALL